MFGSISAYSKKKNTAIGAPGLKELLLGNARSYGIYLALVAVIIIFQVLTGNRLLYPNNVVALFQQNAYVMITAIGMLMIVVATHIDYLLDLLLHSLAA